MWPMKRQEYSWCLSLAVQPFHSLLSPPITLIVLISVITLNNMIARNA